jgi:hypothetical protein
MPQQRQVELRVPVLTTALAVCRVCFPLQDVETLRHVVELLDEFLDTFSSRWTVQRACAAGLPRRALDYLAAHGRDSDWGPDDSGVRCITTYAVRKRHLHVLQWINDNHADGAAWDVRYGLRLTEEAAAEGALAILKWLHANRGEGCTTRAMEEAASNGHLDVVQWLHENYTEGCSSYAMNQAARNGHLEVVRYIHENRRERCTTKAMDDEDCCEGSTREAMRQAAANGHLEVVRWLYANQSEEHMGTALRAAAWCGQAAVVEGLYLIVRGNRRGDAVVREAAQIAHQAGHIEVSTFLEQKLKLKRPHLQ